MLWFNPKLAKEYGTTEVTIDFQRNGNGRELVDFMSYDAKSDCFRCYEIKVTYQDFCISAKKSWYGNYNYLVLSSELYTKRDINYWKKDVPSGVGIIVINTATLDKFVVQKAKRVDITSDIKMNLRK